MQTWPAILKAIDAHGRCALVSVVKVEGSAPRETGARIVVTPTGSHGTIGGGTLEWQAMAEARASLGAAAEGNTIAPHLTRHALGPDLGQCCGGRIELMTEVFDQGARDIVADFARRESAGSFRLTGRIVAPDFVELFGEDRRPLLLFGAGHVGQALVTALASLPFEITWIDPRADAFPATMPETVMPLRVDDPVALLQAAAPGSFVLVMTHSHALDFDIVAAALADRRFAYIGLIGSATKRVRFTHRLQQSGLPDARIANLVCPIGLPGIQSKHPAAIAAATVAQMLIVDERLRPQPARTKTSVLRDACSADDMAVRDSVSGGTAAGSLASACQSCAGHAASITTHHRGK